MREWEREKGLGRESLSVSQYGVWVRRKANAALHLDVGLCDLPGGEKLFAV